MTTTAAKTPNAAHISRCLNRAGLTKRANGKNSGYTVATVKDSRKAINHTTGLPTTLRFPIVQVQWEDATAYAMFRSLIDPKGELEAAETALKSAGYHTERLQSRGLPTLVVIPQELIDWRAEREDRAARAEEIAEEMIPADVESVYVIQRLFPSHERRSAIAPRAKAVTGLANNLRRAGVDVMDTDTAAAEARREHFTGDSTVIGLRQHGSVLLFCPLS